MKLKIPKTGFLYIIERHNAPFEGSKFEIILDNKKFDVVPSNRNQSTEMISDIVVNLDNNCLDKVKPGKELEVIDSINAQLGLSLNELLLG